MGMVFGRGWKSQKGVLFSIYILRDLNGILGDVGYGAELPVIFYVFRYLYIFILNYD